MEYKTLNNGIKMPMLGMGTYKLPNDEMDQILSDALDAGYRAFDTAQLYGNEKEVGHALTTQTKVKRKDLFITTKVWPSEFGYEKTKQSVLNSLKIMGLDYFDLVLLHWPYNDVFGAWKALEDLYKQGKIRAIGVSNFSNDQIENLIYWTDIKPMVNQIETHPFYQRWDNQEYLDKNDIAMESWASFARGREDSFTNPVLAEIGKKYNKSNAQVILRWLIQRGIIVIPKSAHKERMISNIDVFDFELTNEDMKEIKALDENKTLFDDPLNPETVVKISERKYIKEN